MPYSREPMGICERCGTLRPFSEIFCEQCGGRVKRFEGQLTSTTTNELTSEPKSFEVQLTKSPNQPLRHLNDPARILNDAKACLRIIQALKAGRAPREGIRFLSVGLDSTIEKLQNSFQRSSELNPQTFWLIGDYGEGKSHMLRLVASLAEENGYAWAYVVHDKEQLIGLHKPAWLFRNILWSLQWLYPPLRLTKFESLMVAPPSYWLDRRMREEFSGELLRLIAELRQQGFEGLAICIDEVENFLSLTIRQWEIAVQVLKHLHQLPNMPLLCFLGCTRNIVRDELENAIWIETPPLTQEKGSQVAERIYHLHSVAFDWHPTVSVEEISERAWMDAKTAQSGRWRTFVQSVVTQLEIAHQKEHTISNRKLTPLPTSVQTKPVTKVHIMPQTIKTSTLKVGDRVEIMKGALRGWKGTIADIRDDQAEIVLDGRNPFRLCISLDALKKLR